MRREAGQKFTRHGVNAIFQNLPPLKCAEGIPERPRGLAGMIQSIWGSRAPALVGVPPTRTSAANSHQTVHRFGAPVPSAGRRWLRPGTVAIPLQLNRSGLGTRVERLIDLRLVLAFLEQGWLPFHYRRRVSRPSHGFGNQRKSGAGILPQGSCAVGSLIATSPSSKTTAGAEWPMKSWRCDIIRHSSACSS